MRATSINAPAPSSRSLSQARAPDIPILRVYQGIIPFLAAPMILLVLLVAAPQLALWLPTPLYGQ